MFKHVCIEQESIRKNTFLVPILDGFHPDSLSIFIYCPARAIQQAESIQANFDFLCLGVSLVERYIDDLRTSRQQCM